MSRKSTSKWNLFFSYTQIALGIIKGLIIVPFYLKFIGTEMYGLWLATGNILVWLTLIDSGISDVLQQRTAIYFGKKDNILLSKTITSGIILSFLVCLLAYLLSLVFMYFLPMMLGTNLTQENAVLFTAFHLAAIGTSLQLFSFGFAAINLGLLKAIGPGIINIISNLIAIGINIFLLFSGYGILAIAWMQIIMGVLLSAGNGLYLFKISRKENIKVNYDFAYIKSFSKIFTYTFIANFVSRLAQNIDLIFVARFLSPSDVTMLGLTRRPMQTVQGFVNKPSVAFKPALTHLWGEGSFEKVKSYLHRLSNLLLIIIFFVGGGFVLFNKSFIILWVGEENFIGNSLNIILVAGWVLFSITYNASIFLFSIGQIKKYSIGNTIQSTIFILLLFVIGNLFGLLGIVIAMGASLLVSTAWYFPYLLFKINKLSAIQKKKLLTTILISSLIFAINIVISGNIEINNWFILILYTLIYSLIYFCIQILFNRSFRIELVEILSSGMKLLTVRR